MGLGVKPNLDFVITIQSFVDIAIMTIAIVQDMATWFQWHQRHQSAVHSCLMMCSSSTKMLELMLLQERF